MVFFTYMQLYCFVKILKGKNEQSSVQLLLPNCPPPPLKASNVFKKAHTAHHAIMYVT